MVKLSNSAVILLDRLLQQRGPQVSGSWLQDAMAAALDGMPQYRGCFANRGAGQPDIKAGDTGFEVKTTSGSTVELDANYRAIRGQFTHFRLIALRTDIRPYHLWAVELPSDPPHRVQLERIMDSRTPTDARLEEELVRRLSQVVVASGTAWTDAKDRDTACNALSAAVVALREDAAAEAR